MSETIHVIPLDDLKEHVESEDCECHPTVKYVPGGMLIAHNSFDGREFFEKWEDEKGRLKQ